MGSDGFQTAALYAAAGAVVVALLALRLGGGPRRNPWAGLVFAGATVAGFGHQDLLPDDLVIALAVVAAGGLVGELVVRAASSSTWVPAVRAAAVAPGAWLVADAAAIDDPRWVMPALLATVLGGSALAADLDRGDSTSDGGDRTASGSDGWAAGERWTAGLGPLMLAVTVAGVWATVPETQHAVVLAGAAVPVALLGWPRSFASLGGTGAALAVALVAWTSAVGGVGRDGAIVGGFACLGMFVLAPVLRRFGVRPDGGTLLAGHVVLVGLCSRVAGLRSDAATALVLVVAAYLGVAAVSRALGQRQRA